MSFFTDKESGVSSANTVVKKTKQNDKTQTILSIFNVKNKIKQTQYFFIKKGQ